MSSPDENCDGYQVKNLKPVATLQPPKIRIKFETFTNLLYGIQTEGFLEEINCLIPQGTFPVSSYFELTELEQLEISTQIGSRLKHIFVDTSDSEIRKQLAYSLIFTVFLLPDVDVKSKIFDWMVEFMAIAFAVDDVLDGMGFSQQLPLPVQAEIWKGIIGGKFEDSELMVATCPTLEPMMKQFVKLYGAMEEGIPDFRQKNVFLQKALRRYWEAPSFIGSLDFSGYALDTIIGWNGAGQVFLEVAALLKGIQVDEFIRMSLPFQLLTDSYRRASTLINDIFGIRKDLEKSTPSDNYILIKIKRQGLTFDEALKKTFQKLNRSMSSVKVVGEHLVRSFPKDGSVGAFIRLAELTLDGQLYAYNHGAQKGSRYGFLHTEIIGPMSTD